LNGQTDNTAIIVSSPDDIDSIDIHRPLRLYSQTTMSREDYNRLIANIEKRIRDCGVEDADFVAHNTICSRVANRATQLEAFASSVELVVFVSGVNSSNGHYLYEYCRKVQPQTRMISSPDEIEPVWFHNIERVGITGATSTPRWLMEQVKLKIETIC